MTAHDNAPREYTDKIDFSRTVHNWPVRGTLFTYVPNKRLVEYFATLYADGVLDAFSVELGIICIPSSVCVKIECKSAIGDRVDQALKTALRVTDELGYSLYWAEGDYTYRITRSGEILDKCQIEGGG